MQHSVRHSRDCGPGLGLVPSFAINDSASREWQTNGRNGSSHSAGRNGADGGDASPSPSLGNFDRLWEFLSQHPDATTPDGGLGEQFPSDLDLNQKENIGLGKANGLGDQPQRATGNVEDDLEAKEDDSSPNLIKSQRREGRRHLHRASTTIKGKTRDIRAGAVETDSEAEVASPTTAAKARIAVIQRCLAASNDSTAKQSPTQILKQQSRWMTPEKRLAADGTRGPDSFLSPKQVLRSTVRAEEGHLAITAKRKANLLKLLRERFPQDRKYLETTCSLRHPVSPSTQDPAVDGIHVFVDISNILIGFHDALKSSLGISLATRIRHTPLSFHALSLVLERGRPTSKRVVVGSDHLPSINEARRLHYETSILERVHKARDPHHTTPHRKRPSTTLALTTSGASASSSGSEAVLHPRPGPQRRVEQAVDEILHLKMLESVVDAAAPAILVLATGDAAEAEYSPGFRRMVERALAHGWAVELVSWARSIGAAWREEAWRARWGERFVVVELDAFLEELKAA